MANSLKLTVTSPVQSFTEPLTLARVKAFLNLPERSPADSEEDALLTAYISGARAQAEALQQRDLVVKQWDLSLNGFPGGAIELREPLVTVDLVRYRDSAGDYTTLVDGTDYIVDTYNVPGRILPPYGETWPSFTEWPLSAVLVRFTSGYSDTDQFWSDAGMLLKPGMLLLIAHWFQGRLPFDLGSSAIQEYPYSITHCLRTGTLDGIG